MSRTDNVVVLAAVRKMREQQSREGMNVIELLPLQVKGKTPDLDQPERPSPAEH